MTPTLEQQAIIEAARTTRDNLLVNALAGAAKTSTLEMVAKALTREPILSLAFNKRIADEMAKRLPSHVESRTMNSLGHRVWATQTGKRLVIAQDKTRTILKAVIGDTLSKGEQREAWDDFGGLMKLVSKAKMAGLVPNGLAREGCFSITWDDFGDDFDDWIETWQAQVVDETLRRSIVAAFEGGIDFDDQIYMPVCFGGRWPRFPLVLVDEAQDLNPLQHEMLAKLVAKRLIAVGDPWQSIYAFRGAVSNSMAVLRERFAMRELTLSVTFRVPQRGVERAWFRVPHMRWREGAAGGQIRELTSWSAVDIPSEAAIICRNNAPLLSLGFKLLRAHRAIKLVGMDIGAGLVRILRKLGNESLDAEGVDLAIRRWEATALERARKPESVHDRADCLRALTEGRATLGEAILHAERLFRQEGPIQLMSGHKAKGLEWDHVFHLDPWRIPSQFAEPGTEEWEQELNIRYVVETRFKETLTLVNSGDFVV